MQPPIKIEKGMAQKKWHKKIKEKTLQLLDSSAASYSFSPLVLLFPLWQNQNKMF